MRMNRRNVLVGLGTIVAGGGAALGTGAFSSVEASRDVAVDVTGDRSALLGLSITNSTLAGDSNGNGDGGQIKFALNGEDNEALNQNAITKFNDVLEVTNNGGENINVGIYDATLDDDLSGATELVASDEGSISTGMNFIDANDDLTELSGTATLDVIFNLKGESDDSAIPDNIVIEAT